MYLEKIDSPADVKKLSIQELKILSNEIRAAIIEKVSSRGGHFGPNLGMVETTIALHYVFNSPHDKIVFDVSHQSYPHKMLTGRKNGFIFPDEYGKISGYSEPSESEHDHFIIGHTSTSVSLASGLAKGRDLLGEKGNIIAIIGDGSLSGGEAFEGLDFVGEMGTNLIIVVNDNQMSIAENHGGLYKNLQSLRESEGRCECNYFKSLALDYTYVADGNDIESLIKTFNTVKDIDHPIVVHINTLKGKGYEFAEKHKEVYHFRAPFDKNTGKDIHSHEGEDYHSLTAEYLLSKMKKDKSVVAITAGTPTVMGFTPRRRAEAGSQFIDMGIAEEQAVAIASGIAKAGGKPVFGVYSTFIQRAYDQLSQDLCINNNPATILVFGGGINSMSDVTHLCWFDIPLISNIPNMLYLAPTNKEEYFAMLEWSIQQTESPVAIRVPSNGVIAAGCPVSFDSTEKNKYKCVVSGEKVAIIAAGSFFQLGEQVAAKLHDSIGISPTLINPRTLTSIDTELLESIKENHKVVITLEDGIIDGGFGEKISRFYGNTEIKTLNFGLPKQFLDRYNVDQVMKDNSLTPQQIVTEILSAMK